MKNIRMIIKLSIISLKYNKPMQDYFNRKGRILNFFRFSSFNYLT